VPEGASAGVRLESIDLVRGMMIATHNLYLFDRVQSTNPLWRLVHAPGAAIPAYDAWADPASVAGIRQWGAACCGP
jgi:hypothetical protein